MPRNNRPEAPGGVLRKVYETERDVGELRPDVIQSAQVPANRLILGHCPSSAAAEEAAALLDRLRRECFVPGHTVENGIHRR